MNATNARKHSDSRLETRQSRSKNISSSSNATDTILGSHNSSSSTTRKRKIDSCESVPAANVSTLDADSSGGDGSGSTTSLHQSTQAKFSKHDELTNQQLVLTLGSPSSFQEEFLLMSFIMNSDEDFVTSQGRDTPNQRATQRLLSEKLAQQKQSSPGTHRFEVFISDSQAFSNEGVSNVSTKPLKEFLSNNLTKSNGGQSFFSSGLNFLRSQKMASRKFSFDCELGDKWEDQSAQKYRKMFQTLPRSAINISHVIEKLNNNGIRLTGLLSSGSFSHVFTANMFSFQYKVAVKIFEKKMKQKSKQDMESSLALAEITPEEISIHRSLLHRNIVQLYHVELIDHHFVSFLEYCDHSNLSQVVKVCPGGVLDESIGRRYFKDMLEAVGFLHNLNIVHRSIRLENFLLDQLDKIKLSDFSFATKLTLNDQLKNSSYNETSYSCPEILEKIPHNPKLADIWALGVCLHVMLTSKFPFAPIQDAASELKVIRNKPGLEKTVSVGNTNPINISQSLSLTTANQGLNPEDNGSSSNNSTNKGNLNTTISDNEGNYIEPNSSKNTTMPPSSHPSLVKKPSDPLSLMKKGLDLKIVAPSVILSSEAVELLKGMLHYVLKVRFSLNRAKNCAWMKYPNGEDVEVKVEKPYIGHYYLVAGHQKHSSSDKEKELKAALEI